MFQERNNPGNTTQQWLYDLWQSIIECDGSFTKLPASTRAALGLQEAELYIRPRFIELKNAMEPYTKIILNGKAGRGKTVFLVWFMFRILLDAKEARRIRQQSQSFSNYLFEKVFGSSDSTVPDHMYNPVISFCDREKQTYHITLDSFQADKVKGRVHYFISDNVDIAFPAGSVLNLAATSGDLGVLHEFTKRLSECTPGRTLYFPAPNLADVVSIFPDMDSKERQWKYDLVGGNLRVYYSAEQCSHKSKLYKVVRTTLTRLFGDMMEDHVKDWAINVVVSNIDNALDNCLFLEYTTTEDFVKEVEVFVSVALCFVAADLMNATKETRRHTHVEQIIGASGKCKVLKYAAHRDFLQEVTRYYVLVDHQLETPICDFTQEWQKRLICTVDDLPQVPGRGHKRPSTSQREEKCVRRCKVSHN